MPGTSSRTFARNDLNHSESARQRGRPGGIAYLITLCSGHVQQQAPADRGAAVAALAQRWKVVQEKIVPDEGRLFAGAT
jgi:hypothetical protein